MGTREIQSKVTPLLEIRHDGNSKLPENLLSLVRPPVDEPGGVSFFNSGDAPLSFSWRLDAGEWNELTLKPGEARE